MKNLRKLPIKLMERWYRVDWSIETEHAIVESGGFYTEAHLNEVLIPHFAAQTKAGARVGWQAQPAN